MSLLGDDFSGGIFRKGFKGWTPAGTGITLLLFAGLLIGYLLMQGIIAVIMQVGVLGAPAGDEETIVIAALLGLLPMALLIVPVTWIGSRLRGGNPRDVLSLHWPRLTLLGWIVVVIGFVVVAVFTFIVMFAILGLFGVQPPDGGLVENTVSGIANEPWVVAMVVPSLVIGAPVTEELLFRGQIYTALAQSRAGYSGATLLTAAGWAVLHFTGDPLQVVLIFLLGLLLGWIMYRFGSLFLSMACHAAWNGLVSIALVGGAGGG